MKTADAFLADITAHPDDDAPRLIFADWLSDHGDAARGDFIRAQAELARLSEDDPHRADLEHRAGRLLAENGATWLAALPRWLAKETHTFRRGFVAEVTATGLRFLRDGPELCAKTPVESVCLRRLRPHLPGLLAAPHLAGLRRLDLTDNVVRDNDAQALAGSERLAGLRELVLDKSYVWQHGARALVQSPHLANLTTLSLRRTIMDRHGVRGLTDAPHRCRLTRLSLHDNRLDDEGLAAVAASKNLPHLTALDVGYAGISDAGLIALARSALLPRLTSLIVGSHNPFGPTGVAALAAAHRLAELDLQYTNVADAGAAALAGSPSSAHLRSLNLHLCHLTTAGIVALAESPHWANLTTLDISYNDVGGRGTAALVSATLPKLRRLTLQYSRLHAGDIQRLAGAPLLAQLTALDLEGNYDAGAGCAEALAASPHVGNLIDLSLELTGAGDAGAQALAASAAFARLVILNLNRSKIGEAGAQALAASPYLGRLLDLDLSGNEIGNGGARALAESPHLGGLRSLRVSRDKLSKATLAALQARFGARVQVLRF
jgi:uncharacterized protein (TIGR02996 family)